MPYVDTPVYKTEVGHCWTRDDGSVKADDTRVVDAAVGTWVTAVDCMQACTDDMNCGGYERDPVTKVCTLFIIGDLKGDTSLIDAADYTCEVKQY